ncbi:hypothetical protein CLV98_11113 [Dyadobacter jejuensis]|uniref:ABC transporter ATPase n=1 Tax=Dyadobacter jejuensis TaxID=1082580 RepID=A0A316AGV6_9BACT|nr:hypothetical protein [Dyadobacter jejuensis]PWJ56519.1 hypothetical protein CLV98_11113 [Dyadobacter jejuensis]
MYVPFNEIDLNSRIWIFQANRSLTESENDTITETLKSSVENWEAHGKALTASVKLFENRFVVVAVDERDELPSGCSIDKLTHWVQEIGHQLQIDFFDRSLAYLDAQGGLQTVPVPGIKQAVANEIIGRYTTVFDNQVSTKAQWMTKWKVPADHTWLKRYFSGQLSV